MNDFPAGTDQYITYNSYAAHIIECVQDAGGVVTPADLCARLGLDSSDPDVLRAVLVALSDLIEDEALCVGILSNARSGIPIQTTYVLPDAKNVRPANTH